MVLKLSNIEIRLLKTPTPGELDELAEMLMFRSDALTVATCAGDRSLMPEYHRAIMAACAVGGDLFVAIHHQDGHKKIIGCVAFFGPGAEFMSSNEQREQGFADFLKKLPSNWFLESFLPQYAVLSHRVMDPKVKRDAWNVNQLAVHPTYQHMGVASALMAAGEVLARTDVRLRPMILECREETVPMYEHLGYRLLGEEAMEFAPPVGEIQVCMMQKDLNTR
ncbi:unnamed protein product [Somion occarium]|uniref:N-acetyltransferase domain-containing protein n=1 Tax=Somion occarium TaxID=3059160 RepID=A0ABP1EC55_9APHY